MAITYDWNVSTVDTYPTLDSNADVIYNVHWRLNAEDDANQDADENNLTASIYGVEALNTTDISSFIAFNDVTATNVETWVTTTMGADKVQELKDSLDANIALQITPTSVTKNLVG